MSNTLKLFARIIIILALMIAGSWLSGQMFLPDFAASVTVYAVYLLIGIMVGSMANPRFTKPKNKWVYVLPILIFAVIGLMQLLYSPLHVAAWPFGIGAHLVNFSTLAWSIAGFFLSLCFR
jgi:hypothetical protein